MSEKWDMGGGCGTGGMVGLCNLLEAYCYSIGDIIIHKSLKAYKVLKLEDYCHNREGSKIKIWRKRGNSKECKENSIGRTAAGGCFLPWTYIILYVGLH